MYYLGLDIGSSSIKAALVEASTGTSLGLVQEPEAEMGMISVRIGWAEQDPGLWWELACKAIKRLLEESQINPEKVQGIGIAYQMHGLVVLDSEGTPLRNSIIWCDSRSVDLGNEVYSSLGPELCDSRLLNSPGNFTASKLHWVKKNEPEIFDRIHKFMLPGDYIAYRLSGKFSTTISGLSEGILWDFESQTPASFLMKSYGIGDHLVSDLVSTFGFQGSVDARGESESGIPEGTPILYRAGDQPNNALSLNVFEPGEIAATGGTSGVFYAVTNSLSVKETSRVNNFAHVNYDLAGDPRIGKLLCINGAGIQYRWLLNNLSVDSYAQMNTLASEVQIGSEGVCIIPFGNGAERMLDNREVGTHILNLNLNLHDKGHLCRAALEGIAFSFVYGLEIMKSDGIEVQVIRAGNDNLFRSEIFSKTIATLISHDIEIYNTTGAIGAARACGLHEGDFESFGRQILDNDYVMTFHPEKDPLPYREAYRKWKKELEIKLKLS